MSAPVRPAHTEAAEAWRAALEGAAALCEAGIRQIDLPERWSHTDHVLAELAAAIRAMEPGE